MRNRYRMAALLLVMMLLFVSIDAKLVSIQGVSAQRYLTRGMSQRITTVRLQGKRGSIFDRNGNELAISISQTTIWANPHLVADPRVEAEALAPILNADAATLQTKMSSSAQFVYLARKIDDATAGNVTKAKLPGVFELQEPKRFLPDGSLALSLLGDVGLDNTGLSGLEQQYDQGLSGRPGKLIEERDPAGSEIPGGLHQYEPAVNGEDLVLTIDQALQYQTEQALAARIIAARAKGGTAVLMDSKTGELLAVASLTMPSASSGAKAKATPASPVPTPSSTPFTAVYEPGSVNKLITISAALETGVVAPATHLRVPYSIAVGDGVFRDAEAHGVENWSVTDIMANSSNVGTITIAEQLGKDRLNQYLRAFGFGQSSAVQYPGESAGLLPDPRQWSATSIATVPIGQGVAVTAVQMLAAYNTIANDGVYVAPKLVAATVDASGQSHPTPTSDQHRVVSTEVSRAMATMLGEVVRVGTGQQAKIDGYTVAGKTGTARVPLPDARGYMDGVYASSFAGFVPAERPALTGIVVLDQTPDFGGVAAAPLFGTIAGYGLREFRVMPPPPEAPPAGVPLATPQTAQGAGERLAGATPSPSSAAGAAPPTTTPRGRPATTRRPTTTASPGGGAATGPPGGGAATGPPGGGAATRPPGGTAATRGGITTKAPAASTSIPAKR